MLSTLLLVALSKLCRPIIKKLWNIRAVDYANNITIFITIYDWFVIFDFIVCSFVNQLFIVIHKLPLGGPGGIRTPVQNSFLFASYSNNLHYIFILRVCQPIWYSDDNWPQSVYFEPGILRVFGPWLVRILLEF